MLLQREHKVHSSPPVFLPQNEHSSHLVVVITVTFVIYGYLICLRCSQSLTRHPQQKAANVALVGPREAKLGEGVSVYSGAPYLPAKLPPVVTLRQGSAVRPTSNHTSTDDMRTYHSGGQQHAPGRR